MGSVKSCVHSDFAFGYQIFYNWTMSFDSTPPTSFLPIEKLATRTQLRELEELTLWVQHVLDMAPAARQSFMEGSYNPGLFPNVASRCLDVAHPRAYELFWATHKENDHYEHQSFSVVQTLFDKEFIMWGESVFSYYAKAQEFLIECAQKNILPNKDLALLHNKESQERLQKKLFSHISHEAIFLQKLKNGEDMTFFKQSAGDLERAFPLLLAQSSVLQKYQPVLGFFDQLPHLLEKDLLERSLDAHLSLANINEPLARSSVSKI